MATRMSDIGAHAQILTDAGALGPLMPRIGDIRLVMLGEASYVTHDFYHWLQAWISKSWRPIPAACELHGPTVEIGRNID
jgi:hypothetical protein